MTTPSARPRYFLAALSVVLAGPNLWAQTVSTPTTAPAEGSEAREETVVLSPFVVDASGDIGYYAENTVAGSRLNTNVGDLAASITVVTKQQLVDTSSVDLNDIFLYEANTEGLHTYTPTHVNRGWLKDEGAGHSRDSGIAFNASGANRVRGLGRVDTAQNNYPTISRIPLDAYNTQSVEINRGPNSLLFGLGSPAGIVNQSTSPAVLNMRQTEISARVGSFDSFRASITHNQPLIDDKLAINVAALYENKGFQRKPSYDRTRRQYAAMTFRPFQRTTIRASYENYENENNRPNYITPRDRITPWVQAGRPVYNPVTRMVTILDTGETRGPYVTGAASPGYVGTPTPASDRAIDTASSPLFTEGIVFIGSVNHILTVDPEGYGFISKWPGGFSPPTANARTPEQWMMIDRRLTQSKWQTGPGGMAPWYEIGIHDKSIYNWEKVNLTSANFGELWGDTYNVELEQQITKDLFFQVGWFRQSLDTRENYTISQQQSATVFVDTNEVLVDGSPNPHFLAPYMEDYQADTFNNPEENDNVRAMLAYNFDFSDNDNWTRWLGRHRVLGFWSDHEIMTERRRNRLAIIGGDVRYVNPSPTDQWWNYAGYTSSIRRYYYLGENGRITHGSTKLGNPGPRGGNGPTEFVIPTFNWATNQWENAPVVMNTELHSAGFGRNQRQIESRNLALQSYFWDDRIVATLGWRQDDYQARSTNQTGLTGRDLYQGFRLQNTDFVRNRWGEWEELSGTTRTTGVVVKPLSWLSFHYNESDNFNPPEGSQTDFYENPLPKPTGEGQDYGVSVSLFENKLTARLNFWKTSAANARDQFSGTFVDRTHRIDATLLKSWADWIVRIAAGEDPSSDVFGNTQVTPLTDQQRDQIEAIMGLPYEFPAGRSVAVTSSNSGEGAEFSLIYNPVPNWNMKLTVGKQSTVYDNVAPEWDPWVTERKQTWENITAAQALQRAGITGVTIQPLYTTSGGREVSLQKFWDAYGFRGGDLAADNPNGWFDVRRYYEIVTEQEVSNIRAQEGLKSPGQREWSASFISNYQFNEGRLRGLGIGGSLRWAEAAAIGYYGFVDPDGTMRRQNPDDPIFGEANTNVDLWISHTSRIFNDRARLKIQLNARDVFESGGLQAMAANMDGTPYGFRIIDPRQFFLTTTLTF